MLRNARFWRLDRCRRWQRFGFEGVAFRGQVTLRGFKFELLKKERLLTETLEDSDDPAICSGIGCAQGRNGVPVEASNGVVELGDADMEDRLMKLVGVGAGQNARPGYASNTTSLGWNQ